MVNLTYPLYASVQEAHDNEISIYSSTPSDGCIFIASIEKIIFSSPAPKNETSSP